MPPPAGPSLPGGWRPAGAGPTASSGGEGGEVKTSPLPEEVRGTRLPVSRGRAPCWSGGGGGGRWGGREGGRRDGGARRSFFPPRGSAGEDSAGSGSSSRCH